MSNGVTEINEEIKTQLEIIESGGNQIEVINPEKTSIEISSKESSLDTNLNISTETEIITIENITEDTVINISEEPSTTLEVNTTVNSVEIIDRILLSGSFDLTFSNLIDNPFSVTDDGKVGRGLNVPNFELQISGTIFSDIVSSSNVQVDIVSSSNVQVISNGVNDLFTIRSQSRTPIAINPAGIITFDNFQYTPTVVEGGLLYSGSEFYLGLE